MLNIFTNATPRLFITLYKKGTEVIVSEGSINLSKSELTNLVDCLNTTQRCDWEYQDEIRGLLRNVESVFDVEDINNLDISITFPKQLVEASEPTIDNVCEEDYLYDDYVVACDL